MGKGKLIIIESGSDASGKATQSKKLYERLINEGYNCMKITFPDYDSESSALVKMYLRGDFGSNPNDVSPYVASTFYAADRYASFKTKWENFYNEGGIIISDRYTTSNMVHQAAKMDEEEKEKFLNWLWDLEFNLYGIPEPDQVIFLDVDPMVSQQLMKNRLNKITGEEEKDIHESNEEYLVNSYNNSLKIADKYSWNKVKCTEGTALRTIDDIHEEIYKKVKETI
ncbi:deoxynucleoside kinase [Clostridium sp. NSJ-6]|uniref:Thymidylate kinase n=1 Tax=Clostridium hominis TaxID=2763036 RepID=A0ABR7DHB7_9CLOT|nr:deoxynucleoside kinase [Clostridium hominis]MBC5630835.1 deoxynucleoside kinase [Clostridium hominis]MDU2674265.1 deoxynucleoside kinase [Clostridium sp.]